MLCYITLTHRFFAYSFFPRVSITHLSFVSVVYTLDACIELGAMVPEVPNLNAVLQRREKRSEIYNFHLQQLN